MSLIFIFLDGVGLGSEGAHNPLLRRAWSAFDTLTQGQGLYLDAKPVRTDRLYFRAVDATLGLEGLPQSGTGQATLFTGENASRIAGRHFGPFPHSKTRYLLREKSLFHKMKALGLKPHFINAYPDIFFDSMKRKRRWTCTTLMASSSGQTLNGLRQVREGKSLTSGIVQQSWRKNLRLPVDEISPEEAAERLVRVAEEYDLVLFEYYLTDKAGHSMSMEMSEEVLKIVDRFLIRILSSKSEYDHLIICSDHGNLEDLSVKTHTRNPVPLMIHGKGVPTIEEADSIMDLTGILLEICKSG